MSSTIRRLIIVAALLLTIAPFVAVEIPIAYDMMKNLLVARVLEAIDDPGLQYNRYYTPDLGFRPAAAGYAIFIGLLHVFQPFVALRVFLVLFVLLMWLAGGLFLRAVGREEPWLCAIGFLPLCHSYMVYGGLMSYIASFPFFPALLAIYYGVRHRPLRFTLLALWFVGLYLFHIVALAVGAFAVGVIALFRAWREPEARAQAALDYAAMLPAFGVMAAAFLTGERAPGMAPMFQGPLQTIKAFLAFNVSSLSQYAIVFIGGGFVLLTLACAYAFLRGRIDPALAAVAAGLMLIGLLVPIQLGAWWLAGPRTWVYGVMAAIAALQLSARGRKVFTAVAFTVILGSSVTNLQAARRVQQEFDVFLSGLDVIKPGSYILPLLRDPLFPKGGDAQRIPGVNKLQDPFWGIADAYVILRGGAAAYTFAYPSVRTNATALLIDAPGGYQFWYVTDDKTPVAERYRGVGDVYDYVLIYADAPELEQTLASEMDLAFENGPLKIYRTRRSL